MTQLQREKEMKVKERKGKLRREKHIRGKPKLAPTKATEE
jgi:hypothetical protein